MSSCTAVGDKKKAIKGELDLSTWNFEQKGLTDLNGEWDFYWKKLIHPKQSDSSNAGHFLMPGVWNDLMIRNEKLSGDGYATFKLRIKGDFKGKKMGLRVPYHFTAYKLWVNDSLKSQNGIVGVSKEVSKPQTLPKYIYFSSIDNTINLTLQVSNYSYDKGGAPASYKIGLESQIKSLKSRQVALDLILVGILFIMAFHHLGLYFLMKREIYTLYFSILCFLVLFRTIGLGETFLIELFPDFNFEIYTKIIFIGFFIGAPLFVLFIQKLFPSESKDVVGKVFFGVGILFSISLLFPANFSTKLLMPYAIILIFSIIYIFYMVITSCYKKSEGSYIALFGILIFIGTSINDVLYDNNVINSDYYSSFGLVVFTFSQSFLLSLKFSNAFKAIQKLSANIKKINIANSRFVPSEFLSSLGKDNIIDVKLGDHISKEMTVLFADIRSFTSISEGLSPEENFQFINSILNRLGPIVRKNNGFIDKFIGDSIMALFPSNSIDALKTVQGVIAELEAYNTLRLSSGKAPIQLGFGINSGTLMLGTIGEHERMDGTVIADAVNIASRLEGLSKKFGTNIIISQDVKNEVEIEMDIDTRFLGNLAIRGKMKPVAVYEVFSFDRAPLKEIKFQIRDQFEKAVLLFEEKRYKEASKIFESVLTIFSNDKVSTYYIQLIAERLKT